jgi:hypothetical protein
VQLKQNGNGIGIATAAFAAEDVLNERAIANPSTPKNKNTLEIILYIEISH